MSFVLEVQIITGAMKKKGELSINSAKPHSFDNVGVRYGAVQCVAAGAWFSKQAALCPTCHAWSEDPHTFYYKAISVTLNTLQNTGYTLLLAWLIFDVAMAG